MSHPSEVKNIFFTEVCETISASFGSSHPTSGVLETVNFTNTSFGNNTNKWYINDSLVDTTVNLSHSFSTSGNYTIKLEVFSVGEVCTSTYTRMHTVNANLHFCGDLVLPDQSPSECDCVTNYDIDSTGQLTSKTNYRWADRWGNKYCNLSITGNCEDNLPFASPSIPNPPPANCQAGFFNLYFNDTIVGGTTYSIPTAQRDIVCQVFSDMATLITQANPNVLVNFNISAMFDPTSSVLANAGSYYEINPNSYNAIIHGEVWKAINTGMNNATIYDGHVTINLAKLFFTGYNNIVANALPNQFDLYAVIQHELMHALGFTSLITDNSGSSLFISNNLYSSFDEHLKDNGTNVLTNVGPGINYAFNSIGTNCNTLKFNNQNLQQSPVNPYQNNASGGSTFYEPSHFDDICTNNPSLLYAMNSSISQNQQRRLQQEEINVLCKMGYVITGNYGTPTLLVNANTNNPNQTTFIACSGTGLGLHLAANDDDFTTPFVYYTTFCPVQNPTGSYQIDILANDVFPLGTSIANVEDLTTGQLLTATATGFLFSPTYSGLWQIRYRLLHSSGLYSNYAIVSINVYDCFSFPCANNCNNLSGPNNCDLLCNNEMQKENYLGGGFTLWGPTINSNPSNSTFFEGWQSFRGSPDWNLWNVSPTTFNSGKTIATWTTQNISESIGQCVLLDSNKNYILSIYQRRAENTLFQNILPYSIRANIVNTASLPAGYINNVGTTNNSLIFPPIGAQEVLTSPGISPGILPWTQNIAIFTSNLYNNFLFVDGKLVVPSSTNELAYYYFDNIELIEDNFPIGDTILVPCMEPLTLGDSNLCAITNMQYSWFEVDSLGVETGPFALGPMLNISTPASTIYRLKRSMLQQGVQGNNGYELVNSIIGTSSSTDLTPFDVQVDYYIEITSQNGGVNAIIPIFDSVGPYCKNDTIPFLDSISINGITGTWSPSFIVDAPSTTYTFTPNPGQCASPTTLTIDIIPAINPTFNIVTDYCMGDSIPPLPTVSNNGISGTWSPSLSQTVSQLYIFAPNQDSCATSTFVTVWVYDTLQGFPTIPTDTICRNSIINMPIDSLYGISGTWSPVFNNLILGTTMYTFTPNQPCMTPTTWTITVINCGNCDTITSTQISGSIGTFTSTTTLSSGIYRVVGNLDIVGTVNMQNCVIAIEPNCKIKIDTLDHLLLSGSHLYGCHALWDGIVVAAGGRLTATESVQNTNLIEDAKVGVDALAYFSPGTTKRIEIIKTTFNKNKIGIRINGYAFLNPSTIFVLQGNAFTKRALSSIPTVWPNTSSLIAPNPAANNFNFVNPRINPASYAEVSDLLSTLMPNDTLVANIGAISTGIELRNVGASTFGLAIGKTTETDPFVFDRMLYGIDAYSSSVDVQYAYFQAPSGNSNVSIGIRTNSLVATAFDGRLFVNGAAKPVQFYNLYRAIDVINYTQLTLQNTRIRTNRSASTASIGDVGVRYQSVKSNNVTVKNNTIHNVVAGIDSYLGCPSGTTVPISLDISGNSIQGLLPSPANGMMVQQAIRIQNNTASMGGTFSTTLFNVNGNSLSNIKKGILISFLTVPKMKINDNAIVLNESFGLANSNVPNYFGIQLQTVSSPTVAGVLATIQGNTISSATTNAFTTLYQTNLQTRAIMLNSTNKFLISCNVLQKTGVALYFNNTTSNTIRQNSLSGHRFGLWLESATLGQQGTAIYPTENVWTTAAGAWTVVNSLTPLSVSNGYQRIKTYVSGTTNANFSKMFVRNNLTHNPNFIGSASWAFAFGSFPYNSNNSVATITNNPSASTCAPPSSITPPADSLQIALGEENYMLAMEQTANEMDSATLVEAMELIKEMNLYEQLDAEPEWRDSSAVLEEFYEERTEENIGFLLEMDKAIAEKELAIAESYRDSVVDENLLELAVKTVLTAILNFEKGTYTATDLDELYYYANTCSYIYGKATTMARIAYNCIKRESLVFDENCPANLQKNMQISLISPSSETLKLVLFLNPNNGRLFVLSNKVDVLSGNCVIRGLDGREIYVGTIDFEKGITLSNLSLANGIYLIEISAANDTFNKQFVFFK